MAAKKQHLHLLLLQLQHPYNNDTSLALTLVSISCSISWSVRKPRLISVYVLVSMKLSRSVSFDLVSSLARWMESVSFDLETAAHLVVCVVFIHGRSCNYIVAPR